MSIRKRFRRPGLQRLPGYRRGGREVWGVVRRDGGGGASGGLGFVVASHTGSLGGFYLAPTTLPQRQLLVKGIMRFQNGNGVGRRRVHRKYFYATNGSVAVDQARAGVGGVLVVAEPCGDENAGGAQAGSYVLLEEGSYGR